MHWQFSYYQRTQTRHKVLWEFLCKHNSRCLSFFITTMLASRQSVNFKHNGLIRSLIQVETVEQNQRENGGLEIQWMSYSFGNYASVLIGKQAVLSRTHAQHILAYTHTRLTKRKLFRLHIKINCPEVRKLCVLMYVYLHTIVQLSWYYTSLACAVLLSYCLPCSPYTQWSHHSTNHSHPP